MLEFFYNMDYKVEESSCLVPALVHAAVYGIADKYIVQELRILAAKKFGENMPSVTSIQDLLSITQVVYTSTPSMDRTLRDILMDFWIVKGSTILTSQADSAANEVFKEVPDFLLDIAKMFAVSCGKPSFSAICLCGDTMSLGPGDNIFNRRCMKCRRYTREMAEIFVKPLIQIKQFW